MAGIEQGLYDMHGNVFEWVEDVWHDSYQGAPIDGSAWIDSSSRYRVVRNGFWDVDPWGLRSAVRSGLDPSGRIDFPHDFFGLIPEFHSTSGSALPGT